MKLIFLQHRAATLLSCDRIVVLDEGKIIEDGSPIDLMQRQNGIFSSMVKMVDQSAEQRWLQRKNKNQLPIDCIDHNIHQDKYLKKNCIRRIYNVFFLLYIIGIIYFNFFILIVY